MSVNVSFPKNTINSEGQLIVDRNLDLTTVAIHRDGALDATVTATLTNNHDGNYVFAITLTGKYTLYISGQVHGEFEDIGLTADDVITESSIDGATLQVVAGVVSIKNDGVDTAQLADGAVETDQLGTDAVTGAKVADDAIDTEHIADDAVETAQIADDAVTGDQIADDAITHDHISALDFLQLEPVSTALAETAANEGKFFYYKNTVATSPKTYSLKFIIADPDGGYTTKTLTSESETSA